MSDPNDWNKKIIKEFRANDGVVDGHFENMTLLLLHTTGAKSGQPRLNPVAYTIQGDKHMIIASAAGADSHPAWYYNLVANPDIRVEVGTEKFDALAIVTMEPERSELYGKMAAQYPGFAEYERKTERVIPVVLLERLSKNLS
jgi:deazaflavin-dependent oxidoreductase (nitroreductase family)